MPQTSISAGQVWRQTAIINTDQVADGNKIEIILLAHDGKIIQQLEIDRKEFKRNYVKDLKDKYPYVWNKKLFEDIENKSWLAMQEDLKIKKQLEGLGYI